MNQSILFADIQHWDESTQAVRFPAQQAGALIECLITCAELEKLAGIPITGEQQALDNFSQYRFEIEELAEELIEEEEFNSKGEVEVVS
jgi:hypothetical protein